MDYNLLSRRDLLVNIAHMYYVEGFSQEEIGKKISASRSNVSRMLKACHDENIVEIRINYTSSMGLQLQYKLKEVFGLRDVVVIPSESSSEQTKINLGKAGAKYLESTLHDGESLGIAWWGTSLLNLLHEFNPKIPLNVNVVQMLGATGTMNIDTDGLEIARNFGRILNGKSYLLHVPLVVQSQIVRDLLLKEPDIASTLKRAEEVDVALVGIGTNHPEASALVRAGYLAKEESQKLLDIGAIGDICGRQIDINGKQVDLEMNQRVIGIELGKLKKIPHLIGLATGTEKGEILLAAIRGGFIHSLVLDEAAALSLLSLANGKK